MGNYLYFLRMGFNFQIHSFLLLNSQYKLLLSTPDSNISEGMRFFQRGTSCEIARLAGRINQTWHGPYRSCVIPTESNFRNVYKYIYQIPIQAGSVNRVESYPWSSLRGLLGFEKSILPIKDPILFSPDFQTGVLDWLNEYDSIGHRDVGNAVRKGSFKYARCRNTNKFVRESEFQL